MGEYLIPGARSIVEAMNYPSPDESLDGEVWQVVGEGILYRSPTRTDAECAGRYLGFTPSGRSDYDLPEEVLTHLQHLRDYRDADPATITNTQTVHVIKDLIRAVFYLNNRYENEG